MIAWQELTSLTQWTDLIQGSAIKPLIIFKHSTRCSISAMVYNRLNSSSEHSEEASWVFLDLLKHRDISNFVASETQIEHESPQIIILWKGKPVYDASHTAITMQGVVERIKPEYIQN
jgi:bacillithiol system protein YtxJ